MYLHGICSVGENECMQKGGKSLHCTGEEVEMVGDENRRAGEEQEMVGQCGSRR